MNKISKNLLALLAICAAVPVSAQETAEDSTLVNVAFRKVAKQDIMGGVSTVNVRELTEKNYNTYSLDNMQGYVSGYNGAGMWGYTDQLVLIDGVPREANNVKPDEIESITFLKGAQAVVLYGSKAAKGAILITTKRGKVNNGLSVNVRANTGWAVAKSYPEYLGSAEYMYLYNEARANDGISTPLYSAETIAKYASGANPYRYPDVEFYSSEFIKKSYNRTDVTAEIEGGNDRAKFYANVSYYRQGDFLKVGEAANNYVDRFNVRGNVDIKLNNFINAYVNANATYYNSKSANGGSYWEKAATFRPNRVAPLIPLSYIDPNAQQAVTLIGTTKNYLNGCFLGGAQTDLSNIFADYYFAGKNTWTSRQFQFDSGVDVDLNSITKGLSFHAMVAVDYRTAYTTSFNDTYATFTPTWSEYNGKDVIVALNTFDTVDKHSGVQNISGSTDNQTIAFNAHFDYARTFGNVHNVNAMLVANGYQQSESGTYHKVSNANLGLQLGYNYDRKYYADFALAAPWSAKLPEGKRAGFSPSFTLGWNIANENFMKDSAFNDLVLSASYSDLVTDLGIDEYYMYLGAYQSGGWWDWNGMSGHAGVQSKRGSNDDLGYIHRKEFSVNLRGSVLDRALTFDASFFVSKMTGQIITASNQMPSYFMVYYPESSFRPYINFNDDKRTGFDIALNYKKNFGDFGLQVGANYTYYTTKATKRDDTNYADAYQYRQGKPLDAIWGYECLGFFQDEADIKSSPNQSYFGQTIAPGDLKYKDQNNDGVIDNKDQVNLGKGGWYGAPSTLGINVTLKYKNFTLFMLGTGSFGGNGVRNNSYWWVKGEDKYSAAVRDRWTPETANTAAYPRLTTGNGANNYVTSDFWMYSTSRFDLNKVQLSYDFDKKLFGNSFVKGVQVYVSGNSLLTIAKEREILEMSVGSAPQTRFYNLGFKVAF
ncbi:MAG: SusC/RagA family TonB-linked outer membrane protein [Prevotellaceae bacterium]|nr:SusC/RagA family TonB-linked outer membrane protein [Prevotellaceae bacterium]MDY5210634.1 SusC/RagA family TonB-linked outer membrane protein [Prevotella sp.]